MLVKNVISAGEVEKHLIFKRAIWFEFEIIFVILVRKLW